jgi:hypothetical protein
MKRFLTVALIAGFAFGMTTPAWAIKQLNDKFKEFYAGDKGDEKFKELVAEAKCNVCHVEKENKKSVRNPYGEALHDVLEDDKFPLAEFKKDPDKFTDRLNALFKKVEEKESGDAEHKTFGNRIEANLLPGGDAQGKGLGGK